MSSDGSNSSLGQRRGLMLVLSSPSGAGKTTLSRRLLQTDPDIVMSVSATTRPPRPNEIEGQDYFFVSAQTFDAMLQAIQNSELSSSAKENEHTLFAL